jgi:hypothetical protein
MLLNDDFLKNWEAIVDQIDKNHIPFECVKKVVFRTRDRRQKSINLRRLRDEGIDEDALDHLVTNYISENEEKIVSMEFLLDIEALAGIIQPETDKLLRDI